MRKNKSELLCIIGVDGVGKTTHVRMILERMAGNGMKCKCTWFRFNHFFSLILLAYCRVAGLTIYEEISGQRIGRHEFYRSTLACLFYPWLLFADMVPIYALKIFLPLRLGYTVICDRFVYDTLADLMIDLDDPDIHKKLIGKLFLKLVPQNIKVTLLDLDETIIRDRRCDLLGDRSLGKRRKIYVQLAREFNLPIVSNIKSVSEVNDQIYECLCMR